MPRLKGWEEVQRPAVKDLPRWISRCPKDTEEVPRGRYPCWIPDCPDPWYGPMMDKAHPKRYRGKPLGKPGWLCATCYQTLYQRERRRKLKVSRQRNPRKYRPI